MAARRISVLPTNKIIDLLFRSIQHAHSTDLQNTTECHICSDPFLTGRHPERPVLLRCGHVFGEGCILKWMSPLSRNGCQNSCPLCREPLLDLRDLEGPTTLATRAGDDEGSVTWQRFWDDIGDRLRIEWNQVSEEVCHSWRTDMRPALHRAWHQFCSDLHRLYAFVSTVSLLYASVMVLLLYLDVKPLPTPTFVLDLLRGTPAGEIRLQPTLTYR